MVLLITQKQVKSVLDMPLAVEIVEKAFHAYGLGDVQLPPKSYLIFEKGDLRTMPTYIHSETLDAAGIKVVNVHPKNRDLKLPTVMATVMLFDPETGVNTAILDGTYLTDMRTGAVGAVAAKHLSREDSTKVGFIGAGAQARTQLRGLKLVRDIEEVKIWSRTKESAEEFAKYAEKDCAVKAIVASSPEEAAREVDILVTVTPSREPIVKREWVSPGTHINAIGADAEGKQELESELTAKSKIIIDEWTQASHSGEINVPLSEGTITQENIYAELGAIVAGRKPGRENHDEITMFDSTGLAIQDISTAFVSFKKLQEKKAKLQEFSLF